MRKKLTKFLSFILAGTFFYHRFGYFEIIVVDRGSYPMRGEMRERRIRWVRGSYLT